MPVPATVTPVDGRQRLSPGLWIAAAIEVGVAIAVSAILFRSGHASPATGPPMPGMASMRSMHSHNSAEIHLHADTVVVAAVTASMLTWWLVTRARIPAILTAGGLFGLGASETVRTVAVQSHLVGMAALEALFVAAPLLLIAALPRRKEGTSSARSGASTVWVVSAVIINSALLIVLHLPSIHNRAADLDMIPLWLVLLVVAVGLSYWSAVLLTAGRAVPALRRGALIVGQEVGAILGLATLLRPDPHMHHPTMLGLSASLDQRLGGALMLATCAAVTLPLAKHLERQQHRTERDVH